MTAHRPRHGEGGFALVAVIWLAGLVAAVAAAFALAARLHVLETAALNQSLAAEQAANGLVRLAAFRLAADPAGSAAAQNGSSVTCRWSDKIAARIVLQNHAGLLDLNAAPPDLLRRLFEGLGEPPGRARPIVDAITDYRDADEDAVAGGREPEIYDGRSFGPKNAPFQAIEELDQIPGIEDALYRKLLALVTVHSLQPGFAAAAMPRELQSALGFSRDGEPPPEIAGLASQGQSQVFGIDVAVILSTGGRFRRKAIVAMIRQPERPLVLLAWQQGGSFDDFAGQATAPCF